MGNKDNNSTTKNECNNENVILRKKMLDTLDNQSSINIQMNFWFNELMKYHGVSYSAYRMLRFLRRYPDGVEPSVVADNLTIIRQTITNMADDLQKKGLVVRIPHPTDRRRIFLSLSDEGKILSECLVKEMTTVQCNVFEMFTKKEMESYLDIRTKIIQYTESEIKKITADKRV